MKPKKLSLAKKEARNFYLYISPWLIGFALFTIVPMLASLIYSFHNVSFINLSGIGEFVGIANYREIFRDKLFLSSIKNTFFYAFMKTFISLALALMLALLINRKLYANKLIRVLIYLPALIPTVASTMVWSQLFSNDFSLLNYIFSFFGLPPVEWMSYDNAMRSVLIMSITGSIGPAMIIFLAALQGVPKDIMEAATIDGAGSIRKFFRIVLPMISPTILFLAITNIIGGLQAYAEMELLLGVGSDKTLTMAWNIVLNAFSLDGNKTMGYASAQAWVLFLIILVFTLIFFKVANKYTYYSGGKD
jgi:multiple sugar transport system permease protein